MVAQTLAQGQEASVLLYRWPWQARHVVKSLWKKRAYLPSLVFGYRVAVLRETEPALRHATLGQLQAADAFQFAMRFPVRKVGGRRKFAPGRRC